LPAVAVRLRGAEETVLAAMAVDEDMRTNTMSTATSSSKCLIFKRSVFVMINESSDHPAHSE
jgi:hypothetical protein